jgi:LPS sulfotransferase NodH
MAFDYFVVLAEMRTGSNLLESHLNAARDLKCHGELFNPTFIGGQGQKDYLGVSLDQRDRDPWSILTAMRASVTARAAP